MTVIKPLTSYGGEFQIIQDGDVIGAASGGTGLSTFSTTGVLKATDSTTLVVRTMDELREDISAVKSVDSGTPPVSPLVGDTWIDRSTGIKYTYVAGDSASQWVEFGSVPLATNVTMASGDLDGGGPFSKYSPTQFIDGGKP